MSRPPNTLCRVLVYLSCAAITLAGATACSSENTPSQKDVRTLSLGVSKEELSALAYVARDEGFFESNGLDVTFVEYSSSQIALEALLAGDVDVALCADTPIVLAAMEGRPLRIIATAATDANDLKMVARSDAGINAPGDLRGKRVGTRKGTAAHFFLHVFHTKYGMGEQDLTAVYGSFEDVTAGLIDGSLDAVATRQPFIAQLEAALGDRFVLFEEKGLYEKTMNVCVRDGSEVPDDETRGRLIRALIDAEDAAVADTTGKMRQEVASAVGVRPQDLCDCLFMRETVGLRQSLILTLEDQARWAREQRVTTGMVNPDFLLLLDTETLDAVAPDRVTVVR